MENIINTKKNSDKVTIKVSHDASSQYAELAKNWATKTDKTVDGVEYSAKYYASQAKAQAEKADDAISGAQEALESLTTAKTEIDTAKENAINEINSGKDALIEEIKENIDVSVATTESAGIVKPDGTTITITEDGTISSVGGGSSSGSAVWGEITGTLSNQTDLKTELAKYAKKGLTNCTVPVIFDTLIDTDETNGVSRNYIEYSNGFVECWGNVKVSAGKVAYSAFRMGFKRASDYAFGNPISLQITPRLVNSTDEIPTNPLVLVTEIGFSGFTVKNLSGQDLIVSYRACGMSM